MRYTVWIKPVGANSAAVYYVSENEMVGGMTSTVGDAAAEYATSLIEQIEAEDRDNVVSFIEYTDGTKHRLDSLWARFEKNDAPAKPSTVEQLRVLRDENHLCPACMVYDVCAVGQATKQAEALLTSVNACLGFQPHEE